MPCSWTTLKNTILFLLGALLTLVVLHEGTRQLSLFWVAIGLLIWTAGLYVYIERFVNPVLTENEKAAFAAGMAEREKIN